MKKSISIKIKSGDQNESGMQGVQVSQTSQLTDVQKQQQAISNKLKQYAKKQKDEEATTAANQPTNKPPPVETNPQPMSVLSRLQQQQQQQQQQQNGVEKLRAQYQQFQAAGFLNQPPPNLPVGGMFK